MNKGSSKELYWTLEGKRKGELTTGSPGSRMSRDTPYANHVTAPTHLYGNCHVVYTPRDKTLLATC